MKHILLFLAFFLFIDFASGEEFVTKKEVQCDKTDVLIPVLKGKDFEEVPIWFGKGDAKAPNYLLFVNSETRSWTFIQFNKDYACVLGTGESYTVLNRKPYT